MDYRNKSILNLFSLEIRCLCLNEHVQQDTNVMESDFSLWLSDLVGINLSPGKHMSGFTVFNVLVFLILKSFGIVLHSRKQLGSHHTGKTWHIPVH